MNLQAKLLVTLTKNSSKALDQLCGLLRNLALPKSQSGPTEIIQVLEVLRIPPNVARDLRSLIGIVSPWHPGTILASVAMPEAALNENGLSSRREREVRRSW